MYGKEKWNRRIQRRSRKIRRYLPTAVSGLSVLCLSIVFVGTAAKTVETTEVTAAEATSMGAGVVQEEAEGVSEAVEGISQETECMEREAEKQETVETVQTTEQAIVIDPGHGGEDEGCAFEGVEEKEINRIIASLVADKLANLGYTVMLAREGDEYIDKAERVEAANLNNALLYVSIHQNSCEDGSVAGIETWYDGSDTTRDSRRLAQLIQQETIKYTGAVDRGLISESDLCVTCKSTMPACLIETGFLSNTEEREKLNTEAYREQIAEGIANGIDLYLNPKTMYLTFDDGPSAESTEMILDVLKERNIKATFFVVGENVRKYPETAKRIVEEGHTIGIHCDVHDYGALYESVDSYIADFEKAYDTVLAVTGVEAKLFRFPGGSINAYNKGVYEDIIAEMEIRGFIYYDWNASVEDATGGDNTQEVLVQNAVATTLGRQRVVMLAHDRVENTALALNAMIDALPEYSMEPLTAETEPVQF